jgi:hypothetical protein
MFPYSFTNWATPRRKSSGPIVFDRESAKADLNAKEKIAEDVCFPN